MNFDKLSLTIQNIISPYVLSIGLLFFLVGILFFHSMSAYHTQIYLFLIVPSLLLLILSRARFIMLWSTPAFQLFIVFLLYAILSTFWNTPSIDDAKYIKRIIIIFLFVLAIIALHHKNNTLIIKLLLLSSVIYSLAAYYYYFVHFIIEQHSFNTRIIGLGNLSNPLLSSHIYGAFSAFIMAYFVRTKRSFKQDIALILVFIGLFSFVLLTQSRTPLLALTVVVIFLLVQYRSKRTWYFFIIFCSLMAIYFMLNFDLISQRGLSHRPFIWSFTWHEIIKNPLFGTGLGSKISITIESLNTTFSNAHNIHLGLGYNLGFIGLFLWLILLISLVVIFIKNNHSQIAQAGIILLIYGMVAGMTEGGSFFSRPKEIWFLTWLPIALLFAVKNQSLYHPKSQEKK